MFCSQCGTECEDTAKICSNCKTLFEPQESREQSKKNDSSTLRFSPLPMIQLNHQRTPEFIIEPLQASDLPSKQPPSMKTLLQPASETTSKQSPLKKTSLQQTLELMSLKQAIEAAPVQPSEKIEEHKADLKPKRDYKNPINFIKRLLISQRISKKTYIVVSGLAFVVCLSLFVATKSQKKDVYSYEKDCEDKVTRVEYSQNGQLLVGFVDKNQEMIYACPEEKITCNYQSARGDVCAFYHMDEEGIYILDSEGEKTIIYANSHYNISADGSTLAYVKTDHGSYGTLYLQNIKEGSRKEIAEGTYYNAFVMSPDGKTVAFGKQEGELQRLCLSVNGNDYISLGMGKNAIAVSNDGEYLYYVKDGSLFLRKDNKVKRIADDVSGKYYVNLDYSEILFTSYGSLYLSTNGEDKIKIFDSDDYELMLPNSVTTYSIFADILNRVGVPSFTNIIYKQPNGYYYLDAELNTYKLCSQDTDDLHISSTGKTALYSQEGILYAKLDLTSRGEAEEVEKQEHRIQHFYTDDTMKGVYFKENGKLYYVNPNGDQIEIADGVNYEFMDISDGTMYFIEGGRHQCGKLYYSKNGCDKIEVVGADDVQIVSSDSCHLMYGVKDEEDNVRQLYKVKGGKAYIIL